METIISISRIQREALAAAQQYSCVNAACPYPFGTDAAHMFKAFFNQARENRVKNNSSADSSCVSSY